MSHFDHIAIVDWSSGNDTGPRPRKDAIWIGQSGQAPVYARNREVAENTLTALIAATLTAGRRLLVGFDFPFGYPRGFATAVTGRPDPVALWAWLHDHVQDSPKANNRFDVAGQLNRMLPGIGPFWFNALKRDIPDLPRKDTRAGHGMAERRACELATKGAFACWQMGGAGAVGGQVMTGVPLLHRLRQRFAGQIAVWPFEPLTRPVAFVEVWPTLINARVKAHEGQGRIRDAAQVGLLADALARLPQDRLGAMLDVEAPEEGWIFGLGFETELLNACP